MTVLYNEPEPYAAQWLRNLIEAGHLAPGIVDERDIRDLMPEYVGQFRQFHTFCGVGIWPHVLRRAGFRDTDNIWSGSCPCQPFSAAGRGAGVADERHLWPHWFHLISECRPHIIVGEQVASKDGLGWNDLVSADLEGAGYAFGAFDICAAGITVGWEESQGGEWLRRAIRDCADPRIEAMLRDFAEWAGAGNIGDGGKHIRQRQYFVGMADADGRDAGSERQQRSGQYGQQSSDNCAAEWLADDDDEGLEGLPRHACDGFEPRWNDPAAGRPTLNSSNAIGGLADDDDERRKRFGRARDRWTRYADHCGTGSMADGPPSRWREERQNDRGGISGDRAQGLAAGHGSSSDNGLDDSAMPRHPSTRGWQSGQPESRQCLLGMGCEGDGSPATDPPMFGRHTVDWLFCRDAKWRAAEVGTFPLAHVDTNRVGKLRAYGNALDAETAFNFVATVKDIVDFGIDLRIDDEDLIG